MGSNTVLYRVKMNLCHECDCGSLAEEGCPDCHQHPGHHQEGPDQGLGGADEGCQGGKPGEYLVRNSAQRGQRLGCNLVTIKRDQMKMDRKDTRATGTGPELVTAESYVGL